MPRSRQRTRVRRLTDAVIVAVMLASSAVCVDFYSRSHRELEHAKSRHQAVAERVENLNVRIAQLEGEITMLRRNPAVIEMFARQKFGFVREGDLVVRLTPEDDAKDKGSPSARTDETGVGQPAGPATNQRFANQRPATRRLPNQL
jgi:cell division protein FtsB